jgi:hypothetical protein
MRVHFFELGLISDFPCRGIKEDGKETWAELAELELRFLMNWR